MVVIIVPDMVCRHDVREVSASIADLADVVTLQIDLSSRTVRVSGAVDDEAVRAAIAAAGFTAG